MSKLHSVGFLADVALQHFVFYISQHFSVKVRHDIGKITMSLLCTLVFTLKVHPWCITLFVLMFDIFNHAGNATVCIIITLCMHPQSQSVRPFVLMSFAYATPPTVCFILVCYTLFGHNFVILCCYQLKVHQFFIRSCIRQFTEVFFTKPNSRLLIPWWK